jgi:hypothetical protein
MTQREQEEQRSNKLARVNDAWGELSQSEAFQTVMEAAQLHFGMFSQSFLPTDNFNPHAAAQRDGQKTVLAYFALRSARGAAYTEDETVTKPTSAI